MNIPATPSRRDTKPGWLRTHNGYCGRLSMNPIAAETILIGDSLILGLTRYESIWYKFFNKIALNFGIGGDRTQHVLWRARNLNLSPCTKFVVIHCGTNNIDRDPPLAIADGIISIGHTLQQNKSGVKIIISGLLPRDSSNTSLRRRKIVKVNEHLQRSCNRFRNFFYLNHDGDWELKNGNLDPNLFYTDSLHLIEAGNYKFATEITKLLEYIKNDPPVTSPPSHVPYPVPRPVARPVPCRVPSPVHRPVHCAVVTRPVLSSVPRTVPRPVPCPVPFPVPCCSSSCICPSPSPPYDKPFSGRWLCYRSE